MWRAEILCECEDSKSWGWVFSVDHDSERPADISPCATISDARGGTDHCSGEGNDEDEDEVAADDEEDEEEPVDYTDSYFDNGEEDEFNPADDNDKDDY
eukprot:m.715031 g.715031  ORF g.715031 m.715031 type:complete len:99 (+) comp22975_c1_seq1:53-349(+)